MTIAADADGEGRLMTSLPMHSLTRAEEVLSELWPGRAMMLP